jgi:hypothetical protein
MTVRKHLKQLVRERMSKTGENYATARRQIIRLAPEPAGDPALAWHFPGNVPGATALRVLLARAGVRAPHTQEPFSEAMAFGIAGGIGMGVAAFHYAKEDFSSFFIAGRHQWQDDLGYLQQALGRFRLEAHVKESGGAKAADKALREALEQGPCVAWVDMAHLPHRALPTEFSGSGYHVVIVYKIEGDSALLGDLTDDPTPIKLADLERARARIKKQRNRLLSVKPGKASADLPTLVKEGLRACHAGLTSKPKKGFPSMFSLDGLRRWAERLHGSQDKDSWDAVFRPGPNLWRGLTSIHLFSECYGTGGGLCRPLFAEFLTEAGEALGNNSMRALAERYATLGQQWTALAEAALPEDVPLLAEARKCHDRNAELFATGGSVEEKRRVWTRLNELAAQAREEFPLSEAQSAQLRAHLKSRVEKLHAEETAALAELASVAS